MRQSTYKHSALAHCSVHSCSQVSSHTAHTLMGASFTYFATSFFALTKSFFVIAFTWTGESVAG